MKSLKEYLNEDLGCSATAQGISPSIGDMEASGKVTFANPGNTMGMGNPKLPTPEDPGTEPLGRTRKEKRKKKYDNRKLEESILGSNGVGLKHHEIVFCDIAKALKESGVEIDLDSEKFGMKLPYVDDDYNHIQISHTKVLLKNKIDDFDKLRRNVYQTLKKTYPNCKTSKGRTTCYCDISIHMKHDMIMIEIGEDDDTGLYLLCYQPIIDYYKEMK